MNKNSKVVFGGIIGVVILIVILIFSFISSVIKKGSVIENKSLEELVSTINVTEKTPVKASVSLDDTNLYDELPEIEKYPLSIEGKSDVNIEVFSSGEKAGSDYESWLVDVINSFNSSGIKLSSGENVSVSLRQMSSGLGADYISSGKYLPDLYTPSNSLFGEYVIANGGNLTVVNEKLVENTAGILVKKDSGLNSFEDIVQAVKNNKLNLGYTNPQTSASGLNFLLTFLNNENSSDMFGDSNAKSFSDFQNNIPFVAYTTMQMRDSAKNGSLDGMIMEYQTYINDKDLKENYEFIPYGISHNNPLYAVNYDSMSDSKKEAVDLFNQFCMSADSQDLAKEKGFNNDLGYSSDLSFTSSDVSQALHLYKLNKDSGKDIIAVFVADVSGSMDGEPINQLKQSLINGSKYINENNMVGLVSYSSDVNIEVPIAKFDLNQRAYFQGAIENLSAVGGTASYNAVLVACDMIKKAKVDNPDAKVMLFLLSDGYANDGYTLENVTGVLKDEKIPVYTISYTSEADTEAMKKLSDINEAASINADSDDIIYKIKSLFNSQM